MYDAKMDNVPQLIIAGQTNSTLLGTKFFQETNISKMVDDVAVYRHQIQKVITYLKLQMKQFVRHTRKKGVSVIICPNDLLTQKLKTLQIVQLIQLNQNQLLQNSKVLKSS